MDNKTILNLAKGNTNRFALWLSKKGYKIDGNYFRVDGLKSKIPPMLVIEEFVRNDLLKND